MIKRERMKNSVPGKYDWVRYMRRKTLDHNQDNQVAVIGQTGTGKTLTACTVGMMVMNDWHEADITNPTPEQIQIMHDFIDNNVLFDSNSFFSIVGKQHGINTSFVVEEIGVNIDATQWATKINRYMKYLGQTIRHRRYNMFYTVPVLSSSQKQNRILMPIVFKTVYIDRNTNKCFISPKFFPVDPMTGDLMSKNGYPLYVNNKPLNLWGIPLLPKEIITHYERRKKEFTDKLYEQMGDMEEGKEKEMTWWFCENCHRIWSSKNDQVAKCSVCSSGKLIKGEDRRLKRRQVIANSEKLRSSILI
jgi:DNA-directed RNA polymerase subunit RPC12/RpoP